MTEDQLKEAIARAWDRLPSSGPLPDEDRKRFWGAIESLIPYLPYGSRKDPQE